MGEDSGYWDIPRRYLGEIAIRPHPLEFQWIGGVRRVNRQLHVPSAARVRHRLPEISGAGTDQFRAPIEG